MNQITKNSYKNMYARLSRAYTTYIELVRSLRHSGIGQPARTAKILLENLVSCPKHIHPAITDHEGITKKDSDYTFYNWRQELKEMGWLRFVVTNDGKPAIYRPGPRLEQYIKREREYRNVNTYSTESEKEPEKIPSIIGIQNDNRFLEARNKYLEENNVENSKLKLEISKLKKRNLYLDSENFGVKNHNNKFSEENKELQKEVSELRYDCHTLAKEISDLKRDNYNISGEYKKIKKAENPDMTPFLWKLTKDNQPPGSQAKAAMLRDLSSENIKLKIDIDRLNKEIIHVIHKNNTLTADNTKLKKEGDCLRDELADQIKLNNEFRISLLKIQGIIEDGG